MPTAQYRTFKQYAGFVVRGDRPVEAPALTDPHVSWAFYVLSQMEASHWGTVQSYDGAGISAGPLHAIAVSPSSKGQGSLWSLIATIFEQCPRGTSADVDALRDFFGAHAMQVTVDGILVRKDNAKPVGGEDIRELVAARGGLVPASGPDFDRAQDVALLFNRVFSSPATYRAQKIYTIKWLLDGQREVEFNAYTKYSATKIAPSNMSNFLSYATGEQLGPYLDLAMCVYHAFTVNGPAPAADELRKAMVAKTAREFAWKLIHGLGARNFGRWRDTTDNTSRYDHTRIAVTKAGRWPVSMIGEVMPENIG